MTLHDLLSEARELRAQLHDCAELSFAEVRTSETLARWLTEHGLDVVQGVAKTGLVVEVAASRPGPLRLFRTDIDAIGATAEGREVNLGPVLTGRGRSAQHLCGHDGHAAMLAGALAALRAQPDAWSGRVLGVFQPAEEVGQGAQAMLAHDVLRDREVDVAYAIHNQPGLPLGQVGITQGVASLASLGIIVQMRGEPTHASTPHKGNAAISAIATFIRELLALPSHVVPFGSSVLITPTYLDAGKRQFGRVPPLAEMGAVIRGDDDTCLANVLAHAEKRLELLADAYGLQGELEQIEPFPTTVNHHDVVLHVQETLERAGLDVVFRERAQPWSEDFGYFLERWPGALMLLGAGIDHASLHSRSYEFPDSLLETGIELWKALAGWQTRS